MRTRDSRCRRFRPLLTAALVLATVGLGLGQSTSAQAAEITGPERTPTSALVGSQASLEATPLDPARDSPTLLLGPRRNLPLATTARGRGRSVAWIIGGTIGLLGGAALTTTALSGHAAPPHSLTELIAAPSSYPISSAGAGSLLAGYLVTRVGLTRAKRGSTRRRAIVLPRISIALDSVSIGIGGRF